MDLSHSLPSSVGTNPEQLDDVLMLDRRMPNRLVRFLGLEFAPMSQDVLFERIKQAGSQSTRFGYLVTPNVDQIVRVHAQPQSLVLHQDAWANVNDSRILELLAKWSGLSLPACPGSSLVRRIFEELVETEEHIVIIGCTEQVVAALRERFGLSNLHWHEPPMGLKSNPEAIQAAAQFCVNHPARFTFICVGNPQQEMVAHAIKSTGAAVGIGLCVGSSLEFLTGTRKRAPNWIQNLRLEWLFRLLSEPRVLWRRYLVEGPKIFGIWLKWRRELK